MLQLLCPSDPSVQGQTEHRSLILISCVSPPEIATRCMRLWLDVCAPLRAINLSSSLSFYPEFYTINTPKWT